LIEINNDPAFTRYHTQWHCRRCNQLVPDERNYAVADGVHGVIRSTDLVDDAAIVARISTCRLIIIVAAAALVGALSVGSVDRVLRLYLATPFDDAVMDIIRGLICVFAYGVGTGLVGAFVDKTLTRAIQDRATKKRLRGRMAVLKEQDGKS
jgi:hypothetical protein